MSLLLISAQNSELMNVDLPRPEQPENAGWSMKRPQNHCLELQDSGPFEFSFSDVHNLYQIALQSKTLATMITFEFSLANVDCLMPSQVQDTTAE